MKMSLVERARPLGVIAVVASCLAGAVLLVGADNPSDDGPQYTSDGKMLRPGNYREWIFLSSGLGMTYGPLASPGEPRFDNVFVNRTAYRSFLETGKWPDRTVMMLEVRGSQSKGSINKNGHFQDDVVGLEAHVKDRGKWAFFGFRKGEQSSAMIPATASCYSCHQDNGAVDTTFVQFYPTLIETAKAKGTMK